MRGEFRLNGSYSDLRKHGFFVCPTCGSTDIVYDETTSTYVCARCGTVVDVALEDILLSNNNRQPLTMAESEYPTQTNQLMSTHVIGTSAGAAKDSMRQMLFNETMRYISMVEAELEIDIEKDIRLMEIINAINDVISEHVVGKPTHLHKAAMARGVAYIVLQYATVVQDDVLNIILGSNSVKVMFDTIKRYVKNKHTMTKEVKHRILSTARSKALNKDNMVTFSIPYFKSIFYYMLYKTNNIEQFYLVDQFFNHNRLIDVVPIFVKIMKFPKSEKHSILTIYKKTVAKLFKAVYARDFSIYSGMSLLSSKTIFTRSRPIEYHYLVFIANMIRMMKKVPSWPVAAAFANAFVEVMSSVYMLKDINKPERQKLIELADIMLEVLDEIDIELFIEAKENLDDVVNRATKIMLNNIIMYKQGLLREFMITQEAFSLLQKVSYMLKTKRRERRG